MFVETEIIQKAREKATALLNELDPQTFFYHNLAHTQSVVTSAIEIGNHLDLDKKDLEIIVLAAWFHDTGYVQSYQDHESHSMALAQAFLLENEVSDKKIEKVLGCIKATKMPQTPYNVLEQVLCDADLANLGMGNFFEKTTLLQKELNALGIKQLNNEEWRLGDLKFLNDHHYFTEYGQKQLQAGKEKNIKKLQKKIEKDEEKVVKENKKIAQLEAEIAKLTKRIEEEKEKAARPSRGIETMFRTTSTNHLELSSIADNKANIMISVNSIIVSLLISVLFRKFEEYPNLIIPTMILVLVSLATIVFAILATRPNVTKGQFSKEELLTSRTNLLFFGNFHKMELKDYEWGMNELMKDNNLLYNSMIHDIYFLGKVLGRKYRLIRISYTIFMFGFVISILSFVIAMIFFPVE